MKIGKFEISWGGIVYDKFEYVYWFNWLKKEYRHWGEYYIWYDGPHKVFGLWFFNVSWKHRWMTWKDEWVDW